MQPLYAEFWVCAEPDEVTEILGLEPTSIQIKQPYDYWRFACSGEEHGAECLAALIEILQAREAAVLQLTSKYAAEILWVGSIAPNASNSNNNWIIEPSEMEVLSRLKIPLCVQTHIKKS